MAAYIAANGFQTMKLIVYQWKVRIQNLFNAPPPTPTHVTNKFMTVAGKWLYMSFVVKYVYNVIDWIALHAARNFLDGVKHNFR